ncbi:putative beta-lysine N-acetyltransferase [Carboxylicivirga caseinilyticus]|uniref:putative beta-lysine N-acetyltransferase n=1 Tax=Carboxylicivirga caseinilyticus TaxID=3417572 RepID=UPI003D32F67A|nr:putative beta-lysine N-acetyltransferase [Marinilabiliaceae bacterium A049]
MSVFKEEMIMHDVAETIGNSSLIQHGKHNNRIYLMKLDVQEAELVIQQLSVLARQNGYTKIFCKIPKKVAPLFIADGYIMEGHIPHFYEGEHDACFMAKFLSSDRLLHIEKDQLSILSSLLQDEMQSKLIYDSSESGYEVRRLNKEDVDEMVAIYKEVFETYPFPIHEADYIKKTMNENIQYFGAFKNGVIGALASSEVDCKGKNAEMTDFATSAVHRGNGLSSILLKAMEKEMKEQGIYTLYTIARLNSVPMNKTFLRAGYRYSGTLIKNTNIAGTIESMNVYFKHI